MCYPNKIAFENKYLQSLMLLRRVKARVTEDRLMVASQGLLKRDRV